MFDKEKFAALFVGSHFKKSEAIEDTRLKKYVVGSNGVVYQMMDMPFGRITIEADTVTTAEVVKEGYEWKIPKMPFHLLQETVAFFKEVSKDFNEDEAMLQYWYHTKEERYEIVCLKQTTTKVSVIYAPDMEKAQDENWVKVFDIHSHNEMSAFFSTTDDRNEQSTGLYGVVGVVSKDVPDFKFRASFEGEFRTMHVFSLFESPTVADVRYVNGKYQLFDGIDYPKEWMETIKAGKERNVQHELMTQVSETRKTQSVKTSGQSASHFNPTPDEWDLLDYPVRSKPKPSTGKHPVSARRSVYGRMKDALPSRPATPPKNAYTPPEKKVNADHEAIRKSLESLIEEIKQTSPV